jgi:hypothetical protein
MVKLKYHEIIKSGFLGTNLVNSLPKVRSVPAISTINYSVSTAGTVGGKYPLLSIDGADGN